MKTQPKHTPINLKKTLAEMLIYAKEKDRMYREQKKFAQKMFGPVIKKLKLNS